MLIALALAHAAPDAETDETIEEAIDLEYAWEHLSSGEAVAGWTTAELVWVEDEGGDLLCERRWARGWCGTGTFLTEDGGAGEVELSVAKDGRRRLRTVLLTYDDTGAVYLGELRLNRLGARFSGVMELLTDPEWVGVWDEPLRATVDGEEAFDEVDVDGEEEPSEVLDAERAGDIDARRIRPSLERGAADAPAERHRSHP